MTEGGASPAGARAAAAGNGRPQLAVRDLRSGYGAVEVLRGVDLHVAAGEIVAVLGPNGAGKSTLLRTLVGLNRPRGEILLGGERIDGEAPEQILARGMALVPEGRRLFAGMTVLENLRMGAYLERDGSAIEERFEDVFRRFTVLRERRGQLAGTLSGGEQQQLAIARALMGGPRIILLDEPSLGLAPVLIRVVFDLIEELRASGLTVLLVEQNARQALELADRAYVLSTGLMQVEGESARDLAGRRDIEQAYFGEA
ncbi:MAG: ABC transporter ATP-binding protein [Actinobacteria bacterium]|nr:ABC transporter ATP-binding protein [Actinomycetota bacterium]